MVKRKHKANELRVCRNHMQVSKFLVPQFSSAAKNSTTTRQSGETNLFASRQIGNSFPAFLGWPNSEDNTLCEWIQRIHKLKLCVTS